MKIFIFSICRDAFDLKYGVGILRIPEGFDINKIPDESETNDDDDPDEDNSDDSDEDEGGVLILLRICEENFLF